jgi:hypothetical protein
VTAVLPAGQFLEIPAPAEFVTSAHVVHAPSETEAELLLYFPASQNAHCADPTVSLYLPGTQLAHAPPSVPV